MEMPKQIRDRLSEKVRQLVKRNKKGHLKYRDVVVRHIDDLLGCKDTQTKGFYGGWSRCYSDDPKYIAKKYFKSFRVVVYFPWEGIKIILTIAEAEKMDYFKRIISQSFEDAEKPIAFKCIDGYRRVVDGPLLIISMASTESIILEDGKSLREHFAKV